MTTAPAVPRLASTVVLLRDGPRGVEVFMVTRSQGSRFMGGALVFPGGKVDPADHDWAAASGRADGALRLAAVRELFEETGFLMAYEAGRLVGADRAAQVAARWRGGVHGGSVAFCDVLAREGLAPDLDGLTLFARWITPAVVEARFDTHFYVAAAPRDQLGQHDGAELTASRWVTPAQALAEADAGEILVVVPTRLNLMLIADAPTVAAALALLSDRNTDPVLPVPVEGSGGRRVRIPASAGYPMTEMTPTSRR